MQYEKVKTPEELMIFMNQHINYGFIDSNFNKYDSSNEEEFEFGCLYKWHLSSPERLISVKYGHCYDQVELERDFFEKHGYIYKTFYIWFELDYDNPYSTHTFLIYKDSNKWCLFEHSNFQNRGIYEFDRLKDAIKFQCQNHIKYNSKEKPISTDVLNQLTVYEYQKPNYGCNMQEFMNHVLRTGQKVDLEKIK